MSSHEHIYKVHTCTVPSKIIPKEGKSKLS